MARRLITAIAIILSIVLGLIGPAVAAAPPAMARVLIGFDRPPGPAEEAIVHGAGGRVRHTYHLIPAIAASVPEAALPGLLRNPRVTIVEPDIAVYAVDAELDNTWGVKRIGAGTVHDHNKGTGVKVAVIDSGVDYTHPDLDANYAGGYDFVNGDADPMDDNGHGTHVAGTIAAEDNGLGVVGVAPEARIYALKVLDASGSGSYGDVIAALEWAVASGIQVTNNSYGSTSDPGTQVKAAFDNAYAQGVLHIAAAGNGGNSSGTGDNVIYPARWASVLAVAATGQTDTRASFSGTGPDVELAAPGVSINSTLRGGGYGLKSGTSMASPHVAGTAALVIRSGIADSSGNGLVNDEVRQRLDDTADDLGGAGRDWLYGFGLVNAASAAGGALPPPPPPPPPPPTDTMYVDSINMSTGIRTSRNNRSVWAVATVKILDGSGSAVAGAAVAGHWEGATRDSDTGTTNAAGQVSLQSNSVKNPRTVITFRFVVDSMTKTGWTWADSPGEKSAAITYP